MGRAKTSKYIEGEYTLCPYYRKHSSIEIKCEGICGTHSVQVFGSKKEKDDWMYDFCDGNWEGCPYAEALKGEAQ